MTVHIFFSFFPLTPVPLKLLPLRHKQGNTQQMQTHRGRGVHLHFKNSLQKSQPFSEMQNRHHSHPPLLLIVIKFSLIFSFSHLSSPSVWCNSSLSHSLPHHPSLSPCSSEPLTSDPRAGSPAGQEPGEGVGGGGGGLDWEKRKGGRSDTGVCQLSPLAMDTAFTAAAIATGRGCTELLGWSSLL